MKWYPPKPLVFHDVKKTVNKPIEVQLGYDNLSNTYQLSTKWNMKSEIIYFHSHNVAGHNFFYTFGCLTG